MSPLQRRYRDDEVSELVVEEEMGAARSRTTMLLPRLWRRRPVARPMPEAPPVIRMVLFV